MRSRVGTLLFLVVVVISFAASGGNVYESYSGRRGYVQHDLAIERAIADAESQAYQAAECQRQAQAKRDAVAVSQRYYVGPMLRDNDMVWNGRIAIEARRCSDQLEQARELERKASSHLQRAEDARWRAYRTIAARWTIYRD